MTKGQVGSAAMETNAREIFLTVNTHSVTGSYYGKIKMKPDAVGLPTGGTTLDAIMENAKSLAAAYYRVDRDRCAVVLVDDQGVPIEGSEGPDEGAHRGSDLCMLTSVSSTSKLSQTRRWATRTNRTRVSPSCRSAILNRSDGFYASQ